MASSPLQAVLARLQKCRRSGKGYVALCPAHEDSEPSLSVREGDDGRVLLNCHTGCNVKDVVAALGLTMGALWPDGQRPIGGGPPPRQAAQPQPAPEKDDAPDEKRTWPIVAQYDYRDADGHMLFQVVRKEPPLQLDGAKRRKTFLQRRPDAGGGWVWGLGDIVRPLYRLPELLEDLASERTVMLVEGEKDVETARALGYAATTHMGGSNGWRPEYAETLRGAQLVIIPDLDEAGADWALTAGASLHGVAKSLRMLPLPGVPVGGDLTDWVNAGGTRAQLERLLDKAKPWKPGDPVPVAPVTRFRVYSDAELEHLPPMRYLAEGVLPLGALLALYGAPGCGKSFVAIDLALSVATGRVWLGCELDRGSVLYIAAEGSAGLRQRVMAWKQYAHVASASAVGFITETANLMSGADVDHVMHALDALRESPRLVIFDTLARSMPGGNENDTADMSLLIDHADRIRRLTSASVLLVHHTRKDSDQERGSTALRGGVDTLMLAKEEDVRRVLVCEKQKDAAPFDPIGFMLTPVSPSCVVTLASETSGDRPDALTPKFRAVLATLRTDFTDRGATTTEWQRSCAEKIPERSFYRARTWLVRNGFATESGKGIGCRYTLTPSGKGAAATTAKPLPEDNGRTGVVGTPSPPLGGRVPTPPPTSPHVGSPQLLPFSDESGRRGM